MKRRIALIGLGYIGNIHLRLLKESEEWEVAGVYDIKEEITSAMAARYNVPAMPSLESAISCADAVDIATPSGTHFEIASMAVRAGKHVFVEKPVTSEIGDARRLQTLVKEAGVVCQVGHVERFNPAFIAAKPYLSDPAFIEVHRLAQYNPRGTDVSVVLDLMLHDLDLILSFMNADVKRIQASGAALVSPQADLVNARVEFTGGCVANITTSRIPTVNQRKFRVFTKNNLVNINLLEKSLEVVRIGQVKAGSANAIGNGREIIRETPQVLPSNAINDELSAFYKSVSSGKAPGVGIEDAIRALEMAFEIEEKLKG